MKERVKPESTRPDDAQIMITAAIMGWAERAIRNFRSEKDVKAFVGAANDAFKQLKDRKDHIMTPLSFSMYVTDIMARDWPQGNIALIEEVSKLGITPFVNFLGPRLQALSSLAQLLEKKRV